MDHNVRNKLSRQSFKLQNISDGVKAKKVRVYTPNLNVVRNKRKSESLQKAHPKDTNSTIAEKVKVQKTVQMTDVFFEGSSKFQSFSSRHRNRTRDNHKINNSKSKKRFILSSSEEEDTPLNNPDNEVLQKFDNEDGNKVACLEPYTMKQNFHIKSLTSKEKYSDGNVSTTSDSKGKLEIKAALSSFFHGTLYSSDHPALTVFKLPNYISKKSYDTKGSNSVGLSLQESDEGRIGKLVVRRSGKIEAQIGRIRYEVDDTDYLTDTTQILSYTSRDDEASLLMLGQVQKWCSLVPAWNNLVVK